MISPQDLLLWGAVGFVLFGAKRMPEVARSLGSSVVEFKKAMHETSEAINTPAEQLSAPQPVPVKMTAEEVASLKSQAANLFEQANQLKANPMTADAGKAVEEQARALEAKVASAVTA